MRLINADELISIILTNDLCDDDNVDQAILNAPTVEAIPVEWIRKWHGITDIKDFDLREYVKCTMLYMIKDWKNENG